MKTTTLFIRNFILPFCFFSVLSTAAWAQNFANFSGTWEYDKVKSTAGTEQAGYDGKVVRKITQNATSIAYRDTYSRPGSGDWSTTDEVFMLNGKNKVKKQGRETVKKMVKWSTNKENLTLTYMSVYEEKGLSSDLAIAETYSLADGGKTLIIERLFKNGSTGETKATSVYHRR